MAESFKNRVDALTGFASTEDDALSDWLADGAKEIIGILPDNLLQYCSGATRLDGSPSSLPISTDTDMGKILYVTHSNGTRQIPCRLIPAVYSGYANDFSSLTYFGTDSDPVYWISGTQNSSDTTSAASILEVFPTPTSSKTAFVHHVTYPGVLHSWTGIDNFPDNAEYLVALYAAQKALLRRISDLTIPPTVGGDAESLTTSMSAIDGGQIGTDAEFLNFRYWFTTLSEMIEDDEDIELASAQIEKINAYVNTWNIQLQGNLAEMQQYMSLFQTLKADYMAGIQILASGGLSQPQQQARRGR